MTIRFKNLLCADTTKVLEEKETRNDKNTNHIAKINDAVVSVGLQSYENRDDQIIGYVINICYEKGNDISVFFREKEPAIAFESFIIDVIRSEPDYQEIDVLEHGAV